jgi:hypothetical protein
MTAAKCSIWLTSGSLRPSATVDVWKGSHHDRVPGKTSRRIAGTDSEPVDPARW